MKRLIIFSMVLLLALTLIIPTGAAAGIGVVVKLDGKEISFPDAKPYVNQDDRTMVPVRFISESLGCKVEWQEKDQLVTISDSKKRITLRIGENWATVNDGKASTKVEFDTRAVLTGERTFVPLRFISESLGAGVVWDEVNSTVIIRSDGTVESVPEPTPKPTSWKNVEVPMTIVGSDDMPEGFIKPQFVIKHHPDGLGGYFSINLKNVEEYRNSAADYTFKATCLNYDLVNWSIGIPDIKRQDTDYPLQNKFRYKYVTPTLWVAPPQNVKFNSHPELGEVEIQPGVVLEMQVEFYYAGLKQIYRDSIELKAKEEIR